MRAVIVTGGSLSDTAIIREYLHEGAKLIACDSGLKHLFVEGMVPHLILGDYDSVEKPILEQYRVMGCPILTFPVKKDSTDTELGIAEAVKMGADDIVILGGIGTRLDHTLANVHILLPLAEKGIRARLIDEHNIVQLITDKLTIYNKKGSYISLLPLTERVEGVTSTGLEYPLDNMDINMGTSLTVSNVITSDSASVEVRGGVLISIIAKD